VLPGFIQIGLHPEFALAAFALSFAVLAGLGFEQFVRKPALAYALVALIAADLIAVSSGRLMNAFPTAREPGIGPSHFDGSAELMSGVRKLSGAQSPPWRIDTAGDSLSWAMAAPLTKVPTANGNDPFAPARLIRARLAFSPGEPWGRYYEVRDLASPVLDLMNVRYVLARAPLDTAVVENAAGNNAAVENAGLRHAASLPGHEVYENPQALPRFFLVSRVRKAAGLDEAAEWLRAPDFSPATEAIVEGEFDFAPTAGDVSGGNLAVRQYSARRIVLQVESPVPAFLVSSETHYPGWQAFLDNEPAELYFTNVAFRGLLVPEGKHEVVLEFAPAIVRWSAALSLAAWLLWALAWRKRP
jgi:hypothetical protein